ncbi:MAG: hypothetical protein PHG66_02330 [Candidatus Colwellbacteria bacterium]|nr:hypothetical protein [Candidatus Colwellbacteria bacterium]
MSRGKVRYVIAVGVISLLMMFLIPVMKSPEVCTDESQMIVSEPDIHKEAAMTESITRENKNVPSGKYLFLEERYRHLAVEPSFSNIGRSAGGVSFFLPEGEVSVIAPIDGYVHLYFRDKDKRSPRVVFSEVPWDMEFLTSESIMREKRICAIFFESSGWKSVKEGSIQAGEIIGVAIIAGEIYPGKLAEKANFGIMPTKWIADCYQTESPVGPEAYMTSVMNEFEMSDVDKTRH